MTSPVSQSNSSFYDPNAEVCRADDPAASSSTVSTLSPQVSASPAREVTLPPVSITGDAGARQLVERYERARSTPNCSTQAEDAALSCAKAAVSAISTVVTSPSGIVAALAYVRTFLDGTSCGRDLRSYNDCKAQ